MNASCAKRILVVDDEEVVRSLCLRLLMPAGYSVETAANGDEALERLDQQPFDLVLTDLCMPGDLDGLKLGQIIKQRFPQTQVILMTAFPAVDSAVEMLRIKASDYLIKPFDQAELLERVKACFSRVSGT